MDQNVRNRQLACPQIWINFSYNLFKRVIESTRQVEMFMPGLNTHEVQPEEQHKRPDIGERL